MKKYIISAGILIATVSLVSAYVITGKTAVQTDGGMQMIQVQATNATAVQAQTRKVAPTTLVAVPGAMQTNGGIGTAITVRAMPPTMMTHSNVVMTTGDTIVDAKIRTLEQERATKIKAITIEYDTKVKAAIGNLKVTSMTSVSAGVSGSGVDTVSTDDVQPVTATINTVDSAMHATHENGSMHANGNVQVMVAPTGISGFFYRLFHPGK
jgi:hypothetical protein